MKILVCKTGKRKFLTKNQEYSGIFLKKKILRLMC